MQILSGTAKVLSSNHRRVQFAGQAAADSALLAAGQLFKFQGSPNFLIWHTIGSVISLTPTVEIELTADYNPTGTQVAYDTFAAYVVAKDFTVLLGLHEFFGNDVDIRDMLTRNFRILDAAVGAGGGGGGGGAFMAKGTASVTAGAVEKTITGTFPAGGTYLPFITPDWLTTIRLRPGSRSTTQFIVDLSVPAPTGGGNLFWGVSTP